MKQHQLTDIKVWRQTLLLGVNHLTVVDLAKIDTLINSTRVEGYTDRYKTKNWKIMFRDGELIDLDLVSDDRFEIRWEKISREVVKVMIHKYVDDHRGCLLWSDGDHEEPATVVYLAMGLGLQQGGEIIDNIDRLIVAVHSTVSLWRIEIEDDLL